MVSAITCQHGERKAEWKPDAPKRLSLYINTDSGWRYLGSVTNFDWQAKAPDNYDDVAKFADDVINEDQHWI